MSRELRNEQERVEQDHPSRGRYRGDPYEVHGVKEKFGVHREDIPDHGCWENLTGVLKPWNIAAEDVPSPSRQFQI